jgi:1-acyl-sn-glycerol-3-phosphate acyltransferase
MMERPTLLDVARTLRAATTSLATFMARMAILPTDALPSTATEPGLARIRAEFARALDRAGVRVEVRNADRVPRRGGLILMWNQESHLDHLILPVAIPRPFISLYNNAVARTPFYGAHMRASGHVHVDRGDEAQWRAAVARTAERARGGECVLVSPEGTRSRDGRLLPMKRGAFLLAIASACPIVCVTVVGAHARMPRGSPFVRAGTVRVVFSDPIATAGEDERDLEPLQAQVIAAFESLKSEHAIRAERS